MQLGGRWIPASAGMTGEGTRIAYPIGPPAPPSCPRQSPQSPATSSVPVLIPSNRIVDR